MKESLTYIDIHFILVSQVDIVIQHSFTLQYEHQDKPSNQPPVTIQSC